MPKPAKKARQRKNQQERAQRLAAARKKRQRFMLSVMAIIGVIAVAGTLLLTNRSSSDNTWAISPNCPKADGSTKPTLDFTKAPENCISKNKSYEAKFDTTEGTVVVSLDTKNTPKTANNFIVLSRFHYYDNTKIFRTDPSIDIIQGGSPHSQDASDKGPGYYIADEGGPFKYSAGDLVMARDQKGGGAQYFFGTGPNIANLDSQGNYVTFGKTTQGLDVLQKIIGLHQPGGQLGGAPSRDVIVKTVTITEK